MALTKDIKSFETEDCFFFSESLIAYFVNSLLTSGGSLLISDVFNDIWYQNGFIPYLCLNQTLKRKYRDPFLRKRVGGLLKHSNSRFEMGPTLIRVGGPVGYKHTTCSRMHKLHTTTDRIYLIK